MKKYRINITADITKENLQKGTFIFMYRATRIPPHIGIITNGLLYDITSVGPNIGLPITDFYTTALNRKTEVLFIALKFSELDTNQIILKKVKTHFKVTNQTSCLAPVKEFLQEVYNINVSTVTFIFDLLPILYDKKIIKSVSALNLLEKIKNNVLSLNKYTYKDVENCITALNRKEKNLLISNRIFLRTLHKNDVEVMLNWENNTANWKVSGTEIPYKRKEIEAFVNTKQDLSVNKQFRYIICLKEKKKPLGTIDLFEFDDKKKEVGVGILINEKKHRNKGYAFESLNIIIAYCRNELQLVNLFCNIQKENTTSIRLFEKCGFQFIDERVLLENSVNYYKLKL